MSQFPDQGIHGPGSQYVRDPSVYYDAKQIQIAMRNTVVTIMEAHKRFGYTQKEAASSLNFACTDGETIVALRCRTHHSQDPPTLYYACSSEEFSLQGECAKRTALRTPPSSPPSSKSSCNGRPLTPRTARTRNQITLSSGCEGSCSTFIIASEPLDYVDTKWNLVPKDTMIIVSNNSLKLIPLNLPKYSDIGQIELTPAFTAFDDMPQFDEDDTHFTLPQSAEDDQNICEKKTSDFRTIETMRSSPHYTNRNTFRTLAKTPKRMKMLETVGTLYLPKNPKVTKNEGNCCSNVKSDSSKTASLKCSNDTNDETVHEIKHNSFSNNASLTSHGTNFSANNSLSIVAFCLVSFSLGILFQRVTKR